ncbi:GGDEF domain-containing protein [Aquabacterium sp. OR-4]|uniref:GGDEF domain-containing protein n=1 Tax=Aquabacterium sp. OR-4 TaxID=2978127 RepID=UPI0021B42C43|nr:diguanylate cyclase [Aquabacterium sp. OR-4]MDT7833914.1 diguanylate cyclase [Aquabacterium sp. OR-4]
MQYPHTPERSTELLRQALPLMSRQSAALHPMSYAVWYAYVADSASALRVEVDHHLAQRGALDEATTAQLYRRHLADLDPQAAQRVSDGLQQLIGGMSAQAALAKDQTSRYGHALERMAAELAGNTHPDGAPAEAAGPPALLDELRTHTRQMQLDMAQMQQRLSDSQREIDQLRGEVQRARAESQVDALTGLPNRRAFDARLAECLAAASATRTPCLLILDLDHFKRINDSYGHPFGDQVLRAVAQLLQTLVSEPAMAARVGGEEFAVLLPATTLAEALALAEKLRVTVAASRIKRKGSDQPIERISLSQGAALWRPGDVAEALVDRADRALYTAKAAGRDRVAVADH